MVENMVSEEQANVPLPLTAGSLEIERLNSLNAHAFAAFTYKPFQWHLTALHPCLVAIGAWIDDQPVGMVLMELLLAKRTGQVLSVFVTSPLRRRGIAAAMLRAAEREAMQAGMEHMDIVYASGRPATAAVEALLRDAGWEKPERKHWICTAGLKFQTAPWVEQYRLGSEFEVIPWVDLSEEDRAKLHAAEGDWIPEGLNPFHYEVNLDPLCSIALRYHGEPVGWCLAQQRGEDTLVYASSFVRPDIRGRGHLISAYAEACRRQSRQTNRHIGVWIVPMTYPPMAAFADRRMRPYLDAVDEFLRAQKTLHINSVSSPAHEKETTSCH